MIILLFFLCLIFLGLIFFFIFIQIKKRLDSRQEKIQRNKEIDQIGKS